tara:strand:- start:337 stop:1452 length:1116 start_codon:yes stop_codon:yes gene_type:complete
MKFTITKNLFFKTLSHLQSIVDKKNSLPILSNILIEASENKLTLSSTDMDISIKETVNCKVLEDGSTTINAQILYDIIRKLSDSNEIEMISNDGKLMNLRSGESRFSLACLPKEDFPLIDTKNSGSEINIDAQSFRKLIDKTKFAISNEETRYFLNGLYLNLSKEVEDNLLTLVGTDGHRLAKFSSLNNNESIDIPGVIIPKKTILELSKLLVEVSGEIKINVDANKIVFFIDNLILISKLIDGNFPDYKKVIPQTNSNQLIIDRIKLLSAVDRVSTIANEKSPVIKFKLIENLLNMNAINNENSTATENIKAIYSGDQIEIGFNSKYIMDMLNNLEDEEVNLTFKDNSSPITVTEKSNPNLVYVLMPMRV